MASLTEALYTLSTERLRELVERRGIDPKKLALTPNKKHLAQSLSQELNHQPSIAAAIVQCNARQLRLLQILTVCEPGPKSTIGWQCIEDIAGGGDLRTALEQTAEGLEDWGAGVPLFQRPFPAGDRESAGSRVPARRYSLRRCLENYDAQTVKRIVRKLELAPSGETKAINIEAVAEHLLGNAPGLKLHTPLDEEELQTLEYLATLGGAAPRWKSPRRCTKAARTFSLRLAEPLENGPRTQCH